MISPELCALFSAFFLALSSLGSARVVRAGVDPWVLMVVVYLLSGIMVGAILQPSAVLHLGAWEWGLLVTGMGYFGSTVTTPVLAHPNGLTRVCW